ncbi:hypothetical protein UVI_02060420 [Ustilaginoidea virens]|uniref:non-specific serine/threonine protein kinase n=1 Tax=Ustilaginoidea virens TaxID=1159556 RepID=A0A1B5L6U4_USTVR|nr:hypothetical protein UVI_02060420 [Ustilaginoidea virens]
MQHHALFGYPTPPASPAYDHVKCGNSSQPEAYSTRHVASRHVPLAPEQRLGRLLEGKLQLTDILGTGAYGVVYSAADVKTGVRYAVKCLSKFNADGTPLERRQVAYQQREIRLHYLASGHPNVVSMLKIVDDADSIYVILEYCPEGDLFLNITELGQYVGKDELARSVFLQILDAVEHCHKLGIYHRDLKPENILVTDNGNTVKLADFGLAIADERSEDYGCGSTFYMSPECLDASTRKPYYMCAPNDVWSLGVILVNLTCGRNPWKQASFQDSTYRAYAQCRDFLKTILPLTDELNDILGRIFDPNPDLRITLADLRRLIMACPQFTIPAPSAAQLVPDSVGGEEAIVDDYEYDSPLSPASTNSDEGSLTSSGSTLDDLEDLDDDDDDDDDDDFAQEEQQQQQQQQQQQLQLQLQQQRQHQQQQRHDAPAPVCDPAAYGHEQRREDGMFQRHAMSPPFGAQAGALPLPLPLPLHHVPPLPPAACQQAPVPMQAPVPVQVPCQPKSFFLWEVVRYVQQVPMMQHPVAFQQVPFIPSFQGCY